MSLILILIIVLIVFGGGGAYYGRGAGWGGRHYGIGLIGLLILVAIIMLLFRATETAVMMPEQTPQITSP